MSARRARIGAALTEKAARELVLVEVWREDECLRNDPTAPRVHTEWDRFASAGAYIRRVAVCVLDDGDSCARFFAHTPWVEIADYMGGAIALAVEVDELADARRVLAVEGAQALLKLVRERDQLEERLDQMCDARDGAIRAIERMGHTAHCARRLAWGDGACECASPSAPPTPP